MKLKKLLAVSMAAATVLSLAGCGGETGETGQAGGGSVGGDTQQQSAGNEGGGAGGVKQYADVVLGTDYTDLQTTITVFSNRTDLDSDEYQGVTYKQYLEEFNKDYPGITVEITTDTNYADDALTHLQSGDYETVMLIPAVDKADLADYFLSFGDLATMETQVNCANNWMYDDQVYGVPSTITTQGIVYNKKVFEEAGVTELPKTPDEFIAALQKIKDYNSDIIPLYTNYAAGWPMGAWDDYIANTATGDTTYKNQKLLHTQDPFKDYGDGTHPYAVYKILYDAVANGLTEEDYSTTDWEGSKPKLNNGEIACMVLGSWAYPQMRAAGENADDVGYMPFPITVNGEQYGSRGPDYCYAINVNASEDEQAAAMVFIKWMTEKSGYAYNECSLPIVVGSTETMLDFGGVEFISDEPALSGEEDLLNELNAESELNVSNGGNDKIQKIIEHAANGTMSFDDIMAEWNQAWSDAQSRCGVEITE